MNNESIEKAEKLFFEQFQNVDIHNVPLVFILGSPRTGSTLIYQLLINFFDFFYFSNFINDYFSEYPIVGTALNLYLNSQSQVDYKSEYGKTPGNFAPSESSLIFKKWFGGKHPSQTLSAEILPGQKNHLVLTLKSIYGLTQQPILAKNAWNCFRIRSLTKLFPNISFIWIRRDISRSAFSDLNARYTRGSPEIWNSATTANFKEIQQKPYWEQVVEQQYEYNKSIAYDLNRFCPTQYLELWYEDICEQFEIQLNKIKLFFESRSLIIKNKRKIIIPSLINSKPTENADYAKIKYYIDQNFDKLYSYMYVH